MALGIQKGAKGAIWATNVPYWVALQFATAKIGAILVTVNTSYREHEVRYLLTQSECENLFIIDGFRDHDFIQTLYAVAPELRTRTRENMKSDTLPHLRRVFFSGTGKTAGHVLHS
jgi:fatty-acyl-CoA synthase